MEAVLLRQLLSSLCYFSIFFAPFLFPVVVWIASGDFYVAKHAKKALISHALPVAAGIVLLIFTFKSGSFGAAIGYAVVFGIIYFASVVYNIVKGINVLREYV